MNKKIITSLVTILLLTILSLSIFTIYKSQTQSVFNTTNKLVQKDFEVKDGMSAKSVGQTLYKTGLIKNSTLFYMYARFPKIASIITSKPVDTFSIKKGYYELNSKMNLIEIFQEISSGKEKSVLVSIPEGLTISKIAQRFEDAGICNSKKFEKIATTLGKNIFKQVGLNIDNNSVEGFLFPDTYNVPVSYDEEKCIILMLNNFVKNIKSNEETKKLFDLPSDKIYKTIILASIVEREYRAKEEAKTIAGVFLNRLNINMALQSCATVEYIITEIQHKPHPKIISYEDLKIQSLFNTYIHPGLTPTPISNPGFTAINAAINPEKNNYLFFTLTDSENGRHTFSTDFNTHTTATNKFKTKRVIN